MRFKGGLQFLFGCFDQSERSKGTLRVRRAFYDKVRRNGWYKHILYRLSTSASQKGWQLDFLVAEPKVPRAAEEVGRGTTTRYHNYRHSSVIVAMFSASRRVAQTAVKTGTRSMSSAAEVLAGSG